MASELRVNTLKDAAGNNSIATSFVAGGSAKAYVLFDQGVPEIDNSFNTSSLTDSAEGNGDVNWTNAMSNALYITVACTGYVSSATAYNVSLSDVATGQYTVAVTNVFSSIHYAVTGATLGNNEAFNYCATGGGGYEKTSSTANVKLFQYDGSVLDTDTVDLVSHGDLA